MTKTQSPRRIIPAAEVVLVGGGHSHLEVIHRYGTLDSKPYRLTLINQAPIVAYAGRLASLVAGACEEEDALVDLGHLCHRNGVRFVKSRVEKIAPATRFVHIDRSPLPMRFDTLSIDLGDQPNIAEIPGLAPEQTIGTTRVVELVESLNRLDTMLATNSSPVSLVATGIDVPGLELLLALSERFQGKSLSITIVVDRDRLFLNLNDRVAQTLLDWCSKANYKIIFNQSIQSADSKKVILKDGQKLACDMVFWGEAHKRSSLLSHSGLELTANGQVAVNDNLESSSHDGIYAAGDSAGIDSPISISKTGVYGRQLGRILAENITRRFTGLAQLHYQTKRFPLTFFSNGQKEAMAMFGNWSLTLPSLIAIKNNYDRKKMEQFRPSPESARVPTFIESGNLNETPCSASGATLPADLLASMPRPRDYEFLETGDRTTGESVISLGSDPNLPKLVQAVAHHRSFSRDLYNFGRITAAHCLTSIYAKGIKPISAHIISTIAFGPKQAMTEDLSLLLDGAISILDHDEVAVAASHSQFGIEPGLGMMVQAPTIEKNVWGHQNVAEGDLLVITKPLGSGILFAAHERYHLSSTDFYTAMDQMSQSHCEAIPLCRAAGVVGATGFGGYGLAWHLADLAAHSGLHLQLDLDAIPVYTGIFAAMSAGIRGSLHIQNRMPFDRSLQGLDKRQLTVAETLFDPQTAGGIVIAVAPDQATDLVDKLKGIGLSESAIIGKAVAMHEDYPQIRLKPESN